MARPSAHFSRLFLWIATVSAFSLLAGHAGVAYWMLSPVRSVPGFSIAAIVLVTGTHLGLVGGFLSRLWHRRTEDRPAQKR